MKLDNTFFASMNFVTKHINGAFFVTIKHLVNTLQNPETASAGEIGTDDIMADKVKQIDEECAETLSKLRASAQKVLDIYNEVTLSRIDAVPGSMIQNGAFTSAK